MSREIAADYFHWLCELISVDAGEDSFWSLSSYLDHFPFAYILPMDENREIDGRLLRDEYGLDDTYIAPVSVLEVLIGLAKRMEFEMEGSVEDNTVPRWFWEMIENLGLSDFSDGEWYSLGGEKTVSEIVSNFLDRKYDFDGNGGIFPLLKAEKDQRKEEIWYQMQAYLLENYGF